MARTNIPFEDKVTLRPRNDFVVIRALERGMTETGVYLPDISAQSKILKIIAIGPDVKDLDVGDRVLAVGTPGQDLVSLADHVPNGKGLFLTKQANVILVLTNKSEAKEC